MVEWMTKTNVRVDGVLTYQFSKLEAALKHVRRFRTALDIGAHVGTWSMHMVRRFERVIAFEPLLEHRECFKRNVLNANVTLLSCALGAKTEQVRMKVHTGSSGSTHVNGAGDISVVTLDSLLGLNDIDFIKLDVEGYELFVVQGGEKTIRENRPTMVVEQKPKNLAERYGATRMAAVELLQSWGAKVVKEMSGDYILTWPRMENSGG
jgi:FkbM family methyltransferase